MGWRIMGQRMRYSIPLVFDIVETKIANERMCRGEQSELGDNLLD